MFEDNRGITISFIIAVAAFSLLFVLGIDRVQHTALPVCGVAMVLILLSFFGWPVLAKQLSRGRAQSRRSREIRRVKAERQQVVKSEIASVRSGIKHNLDILGTGGASQHARAVDHLLGYGPVATKPMCDLFQQATDALVAYSDGAAPKYSRAVDWEGRRTSLPTSYGHWEEEARRLSSIVFNLSKGLAQLGDPQTLPTLLYGYDRIHKQIHLKYRDARRTYHFEALWCWGGMALDEIIKDACEKIAGEEVDIKKWLT